MLGGLCIWPVHHMQVQGVQLLPRLGIMSLTIGIVGLPNVGKSTMFNALTRNNVLAENYPFATIEPNVGIVPVPDDRLQALAEIDHPAKIVPATVTFVDIAGIVKGASEGEGLGNKFLANIREADAIFREEIVAAGLEKQVNQYFAVLTNVRSVGVMGDARTYDYTVALRAVTTTDFMTAEWAQLPYELLARASSRITNEVPNVNRVVYDITTKPPATVEWE